jgi:flagellar assembly protein FliH
MSSSREGALLRGDLAARAVSYRDLTAAGQAPSQSSPVERRTTIRRAADQPVPGDRPSFRLGDVYAEELARLRERAHAEGYAVGYAEGIKAAEVVVAEEQRAAAERFAEAQTRWERRVVSATAALGSAVRQLDEAALPTADDVRETILGTVLTLVEDLLGRELSVAEAPGLDALRRALTLCPTDSPTVVRLHPDDLAEIPPAALADLPDTVTVVADERVDRAGALAETGSRHVDAQLGPALQRVQAVLNS